MSTESSTALAVYAVPQQSEIAAIKQYGADLIASGFLPTHIKKPEQALAIILQGRELNIPPMFAIRNIYLVDGKVSLSADLMAALIQRAVDQQGDGEFTVAEMTPKRAVVRYRRWRQESAQSYAYTIEDAQTAGLAGRNTWKQHPAQMLRARAISHCARAGFPDVIAGMYTPDEVDDFPAGTTTITTPPFDASIPNIDLNRNSTTPEIIDAEVRPITRERIFPDLDDDEVATKDAKVYLYRAFREHAFDFLTEAVGKHEAVQAAAKWRQDAYFTVFVEVFAALDPASISMRDLRSLVNALEDPQAIDDIKRTTEQAWKDDPEIQAQRDKLTAALDQASTDNAIASTITEAGADHAVTPEYEAWKDRIDLLPVHEWKSVYAEAVETPWKLARMIQVAPHLGAVKMLEGQAKKAGLMDAMDIVFEQRTKELKAAS